MRSCLQRRESRSGDQLLDNRYQFKDSRDYVVGRSVCPKIVAYSRGFKGHNRVDSTGKWFIPCSGSLPTNTSVYV